MRFGSRHFSLAIAAVSFTSSALLATTNVAYGEYTGLSNVQQGQVVDIMKDMQAFPVDNVTYLLPTVSYSANGQVFFTEGSYQQLDDGKMRIRIEVRQKAQTDLTPTGRNSPVVEDTGFKVVNSLAEGKILRTTGGIETRIWMAPPQGTDQFPTLNASVSNPMAGTVLSCARSVVSAPLSRIISDNSATAATCTQLSPIEYGKPDFDGFGFTLRTGIRMAADNATALRICQSKGFQRVAHTTVRRFSSPGNNTVVKYENGQWIFMNARAFNNVMDPGDLTCANDRN